jgi:hypothetical protein
MITVDIKQDDKTVGMMGKIQIGEKRYQVQVQLVEIGSKPKMEEKALNP